MYRSKTRNIGVQYELRGSSGTGVPASGSDERVVSRMGICMGEAALLRHRGPLLLTVFFLTHSSLFRAQKMYSKLIFVNWSPLRRTWISRIGAINSLTQLAVPCCSLWTAGAVFSSFSIQMQSIALYKTMHFAAVVGSFSMWFFSSLYLQAPCDAATRKWRDVLDWQLRVSWYRTSSWQ